MRWLLLVLAFALAIPDAYARGGGGHSSGGGFSGGGHSSGGYSLPSGGSRTPSFSSSPSSSGGYSLPSSRGSGSSAYGYQGEGDRSFSRQQSGTGLSGYRDQQEQARQPAGPSYGAPSYGAPSYAAPSYGGYRSSPSYGGSYGYTSPVPLNQRQDWLGQRGYPAPAYAFGGQRQFGIWDGVFLWAMLSNLNRSSSSDWFHNHEDDPGYRQWRAEADRQAQTNDEVRQHLAQLDQTLSSRQAEPKDPNYLPPDVPAAVAQAPGAANIRTPSSIAANDNMPSSGHAWVWIVVFAGGAFAVLWYLRSRSHGVTPGAPVSTLGTAANMVRHKLSGEGYTPEKFRVGMTVSADPTPFILLGAATKVSQPSFSSAVTSVTEVGRIEDAGAHLVRLYLDPRSYVQLHVAGDGDPDECRYFTQIDEIQPADAQEWGVWLDDNQGLIGWPQFQTKDGKLYDRLWAPGQQRIAPRTLTETIEGVGAKRSVRSQAMLYAARTGAPAPAPQMEYILVAAMEEGAQAWVEVRAGIDLNPATLQLS